MARSCARGLLAVLVRGANLPGVLLILGVSDLLEWGGPVKRSQALRGRNLARNSRIDGAPKRTHPWATSSFRGRFVFRPFGHRSYASENPEGEALAPCCQVGISKKKAGRAAPKGGPINLSI
jgi:hypothetical protein